MTDLQHDATADADVAHVLIVDDRKENLIALEAALEPLEVAIDRALTPQEALELVAQRDYAVIVLDVQMPGMDGYEVARRIKQLPRRDLSPIIFVTALDRDRRHVHAGYESGAVDYLFKPLDPDELRAKVSAFVRLYAQRAAEERRERLRYADLTDRAEVERDRLMLEVERERSRLATVFRDAPAFLAVLRGPDHVFELANNAYYQLIGHREVIGKPVHEALPDIRGQGFEEQLDRVYHSGERVVGREVSIMLQRTAGAPPEERFLDFTYLPLVEPDGTRSGVVAYGLDVTDHVAARREVERSRDRIERLQSLTAALAESNTPGNVAGVMMDAGVAALKAATGIFAMRHRFEAGQAVLLDSKGFPEEFVRQWRQFPLTADSPLAQSLRTGEALFAETRNECVTRFPGVAELWDRLGTQALATIPLSVGGETVGAMSFTFREARSFAPDDREFFVTLGRQAAVALERARLIAALTEQREAALAARAEAEFAAAAKGQFLATMSHELRTPINAQIGYTQLLAMELAGPLTPEQRDYLTRLARSSEHLLALINDVLDISKIEAGELTAERVDAWTGSAVDSALELTRPLADQRGLRIDNLRPDPLGVRYVGDEQRVRQVVVNLLSNAVKFTDPGGTIAVECGTLHGTPPGSKLKGSGPWSFIRVKDTGIGIAPEQLSRIFEPFHQVDGGHTRAHGGTGLGLAISRRLARIMGGNLTAESEPGRGSVFTLWLPAAAETLETPAAGRETPDERHARATVAPSVDALGVEQISEYLKAAFDDVMKSYCRRLRAEPLIPLARTMRDAEVEDHQATLLADLAQSLAIIAAGGPEAAEMLRDGSAIQRTISEHHGTRRHAQGWSEPAVQRDAQIMREEVERAIRQRFHSAGGAASEQHTAATEAAVQVLLDLMERVETLSVRAWRQASLRA